MINPEFFGAIAEGLGGYPCYSKNDFFVVVPRNQIIFESNGFVRDKGVRPLLLNTDLEPNETIGTYYYVEDLEKENPDNLEIVMGSWIYPSSVTLPSNRIYLEGGLNS